jgi:hypothetical protein
VFVGHLSVAFAAKKVSHATSLVWFVVAANFIDLLWPLFLLLGIERVSVVPGISAFTPLRFDAYPWSHSLLMVVVWGVALGAFARWRGVSPTGARLVGALVVSHWVLDFVTHVPDLTLWPGATTGYGLALWNSIPASFAVETTMWVAGLGIFLSLRRPRGVQGQVALWSFVLVSTLLWASGPFSPPPPTPEAIAWFGLFGWIIVPWAWWIERTSEPRAARASPIASAARAT